ncbi:5'-3' exonuclease [Shouchella clausii]|uniref:5'-3' exonuclease n=1 Tax=Shouchella clausii TaxID=79880 RepID=A0A268P2V6_SHOCL|nr:5'-3' exonuclease H3TH domain-containing protein [Shouchella clausii]PAE90011.1 flap endonuclease [Shouchella clausii]
MANEQALLLVDGFNLLSRGYFATSYNRPIEKLERNEEGLYVNGLRVFIQKLFKLVTDYSISHCIVTWDVPREEALRRKTFPDYKLTRNELPEPLIQQYQQCVKTLSHIGVEQLKVPPYEADDIIGAISAKWEAETSGPCYIYSNDKDLFQLLTSRTTQIVAKKQTEVLLDEASFKASYGLSPTQWVDVKALVGDTSDNIPGCPGIGEKTALPLIAAYGSIESLYQQIDTIQPPLKRAQKKLLAGQASTQLSKKLSAIICDIPELRHYSINDAVLSLNRGEVDKELSRLAIRVKLADELAFIS